MKRAKCPNCKFYQDLDARKISRIVQLGDVGRFVCDGCGFSTEIVVEKQHKERYVVFFAMSEIKDYP